LSAIFWTLGYDTIYGAQDITDDEIIGLKSTSIKFKKNIKFFVSINYLITSAYAINDLFFKFNLGLKYFTLLLIIVCLSLGISNKRLIKFHYLKMFERHLRLNNFSGLCYF
jgi:4-hydroxybenzoate polyprenyltransferase